MNKYYKKIRSRSKYREFIKVLNGILCLTEREIDILLMLLLIDEEVGEEYIESNGILNRTTRARIKSEGRLSKSNLSKIESKLKLKGVIIQNGNGHLIINPLFKPTFKNGELEIVFILDLKTEKDETITI